VTGLSDTIEETDSGGVLIGPRCATLHSRSIVRSGHVTPCSRARFSQGHRRRLGTWLVTPKLKGERASDHFDTAIWQPPARAADALGAVDFLDASRISNSEESPAGRLYTALG
jgi:hypothetical protein